MPESCNIIIDKLIDERHNKGMTQKDLAKAANLTQSVIARLERKKSNTAARYTFKGCCRS